VHTALTAICQSQWLATLLDVIDTGKKFSLTGKYLMAVATYQLVLMYLNTLLDVKWVSEHFIPYNQKGF
jgi:hypothetical protein